MQSGRVGWLSVRCGRPSGSQAGPGFDRLRGKFTGDFGVRRVRHSRAGKQARQGRTDDARGNGNFAPLDPSLRLPQARGCCKEPRLRHWNSLTWGGNWSRARTAPVHQLPAVTLAAATNLLRPALRPDVKTLQNNALTRTH